MGLPKRRNAVAHKPTVLIVDDQHHALVSLSRLIEPGSFAVEWVPDEQRGLEILQDRSTKVEIIIVDLKSSGMGGGGFFQRARYLAPKAAFLITGPLGPILYKSGSFYEFSGFGLKKEINGILASIAQQQGNGRAPGRQRGRQGECKERFGTIIGRSEGINVIYRLIEKLKTSASTVLIQGESGTGKELIAQTIHHTSLRKNRPFVAINCGAIPASLMESELFGHERGAFTTAMHQRKGKFEVAEGGTLFLDEVGELVRELQVKLLRVLQEKEFQRVGGNRTLRSDVRIIAATSQDVKRVVQAGHFREDLFFRLNVVPIRIPPLRKRREDISLLLDHFFAKGAEDLGRQQPLLTKAAQAALLDYNYPGNVRELINLVERLLVTCPNGQIALNDLPRELRARAAGFPESAQLLHDLPDGGARLQDVEKELILKTLNATSGNKAAAARMLGITRRRLYLRLAEYERASS